MTTPPPVRKMFDFSGQAMCGYFEETLECALYDHQTFGLNNDCNVPNTLLHDEDGNVWLVYRFTDYKGTAGLLISTNAEGRKLSEPHPIVAKAYAGPCTQTIEGDSHFIRNLSPGSNRYTPADKGFVYRRSLENIEWIENDIMELTGVRMCPAKCWFDFDSKGGMGFISFISRVEGTLLGRKVNGFSEFAIQFLPPGQSLITEYRDKASSWMIICNEYDNGEYDFGHVGLLASGSRFGMIADQNGPRLASNNTNFEAYVNEDGFPEKLIYSVEGERWIWRPIPNGDVGTLDSPITRDRIGIGQREGDTRTPRYSYGWVNFFLNDGLKPYIRPYVD